MAEKRMPRRSWKGSRKAPMEFPEPPSCSNTCKSQKEKDINDKSNIFVSGRQRGRGPDLVKDPGVDPRQVEDAVWVIRARHGRQQDHANEEIKHTTLNGDCHHGEARWCAKGITNGILATCNIFSEPPRHSALFCRELARKKSCKYHLENVCNKLAITKTAVGARRGAAIAIKRISTPRHSVQPRPELSRPPT